MSSGKEVWLAGADAAWLGWGQCWDCPPGSSLHSSVQQALMDPLLGSALQGNSEHRALQGHSRGGFVREQHFPLMPAPEGPELCPCCHLNAAGSLLPLPVTHPERMHRESSGRAGTGSSAISVCLCPAHTVPPPIEQGRGREGWAQPALSTEGRDTQSAKCRKGLESPLRDRQIEKLCLADKNCHGTQKCRDHQGSASASSSSTGGTESREPRGTAGSWQ